jgi:acetyl-CoA carboxylase biotin carboxyl carrier protein
MAKPKGTPEIDADIVRTLADLLHEKDLSEIEYSGEDWHVRVAKGTPGGSVISAPAPAATPAPVTAAVAEASKPAETVADHPGVVASPMVGTVYLSDEPDAPPFVSVGDSVAEGETLVLIEAMKVFNPIKAPKGGKISQILISNGDPVEFGEPLLIIE